MAANQARELAQKYAQIVAREYQPKAIVLYGSHVQSAACADSDIDVAIIFDGYTGDAWRDSARLWHLTREVSLEIEPVILDVQDDASGFASKILATGESLVV
ncbi:MAG: nucleotidyltransferase domain-containing protein [Coriobacteriia bacterium]|nr:nucleotidyltransferase domain-containing protein [Coriobacteriia bacterium]